MSADVYTPAASPRRPAPARALVPPILAGRGDSGAGLAVGGGVALVLAFAAFFADGGLRLERTTYLEVIVMVLGSVLCAAALLVPRARVQRMHGGVTLAAVAVLAAYTALSILWSLAPSDSWIEANRTFSYLAAFAGSMALARLAPGHWAAVLHGIAIACVIVCGWALITKVFPGTLSEDEIYARLRAPYDYWNAVGLTAALGILPLLWLGARRSGRAAVNALAWPGIGLLEVALMLSFSRGALLALRARARVLVRASSRCGCAARSCCSGRRPAAAAIVGWAFSMTGLTTDNLPLAVRADTGHELGALLLVMLVALTALGLVAGFLASERPASPQAKWIAGRTLLVLVAAVPVVAVIALATADGGIGGQVSKGWNQLTNPNASTPDNTPGRLTETSSVRARYWDEAFKVHGVSPWIGTGAGAYATVRTRFRTGTLFVRHAHGYVPQTLADLGWVGLALSLLALGLWGRRVQLVLGMRPRDRGLPWDAERVGMAALVAVAITFGVHSAVDWTWFIPATALCGLLAAGFVAARPPLRTRMEAAALDLSVPVAVRARPADPAPLWAPPAEEVPAIADIAGPGALVVADAALAPARAVPVVAGRRGGPGRGARARGVVGGDPAGAQRSTPATRRSSGCRPATSRPRSTSRTSRTTATRSPPTRSGSWPTSSSSAAAWPTRRTPWRRRSGSSPRAPRPGAGSGASSSPCSTSPPTRSRRSGRRTSSTRATPSRSRTSSRRAARTGSPPRCRPLAPDRAGDERLPQQRRRRRAAAARRPRSPWRAARG